MWFPTLYLIPIPISISFPWLKAHGNSQSKPPLNSVHCLLVSWFSLFSWYFLILLLLGFLFWAFLSFLSFSVRPFIASCHGKSKFLTVTTKRCRFRVMFNSVFVVYSSKVAVMFATQTTAVWIKATTPYWEHEQPSLLPLLWSFRYEALFGMRVQTHIFNF